MQYYYQKHYTTNQQGNTKPNTLISTFVCSLISPRET